LDTRLLESQYYITGELSAILIKKAKARLPERNPRGLLLSKAEIKNEHA